MFFRNLILSIFIFSLTNSWANILKHNIIQKKHDKEINNKSFKEDEQALDLFTSDIEKLPKPNFKPSNFFVKYTKIVGGKLLCFYLDLQESLIERYKKMIRTLKLLRYQRNIKINKE